jgi:uncharacterized protein with HEPN domain
MPRREELYLADIVAACRYVADFLDGLTPDDWADSDLVRFAVLQRLTVIGEAAGRLDPAICARYPQVPWRDLVAFRNLAVHDYFAVEWPLVWAIASQDVPRLSRQMREILATDYPLVLATLDSD